MLVPTPADQRTKHAYLAKECMEQLKIYKISS